MWAESEAGMEEKGMILIVHTLQKIKRKKIEKEKRFKKTEKDLLKEDEKRPVHIMLLTADPISKPSTLK